MPEKPATSTFEINVGTATAKSAQPIDPGAPFRMLILGDVTGRANRRLVDTAELKTRKLIAIDRDNFDDVLQKLQPTLELRLGSDQAAPSQIPFRELDDFHPDRLFARLELFEQLRSLRRRLKNNDTFAQAAAELQSGAIDSVAQPEPAAAPEPAEEPPPEIPASGLLDAALEATEQPAAAAADSTPMDRVIQEIIAPYIEPAADPRQPEFVAAVDSAIGEQMRRLLHHPEFQALEAAWRGLYLLVRRLETGSKLKLELLDVSIEEITADLGACDNPIESGIGKLLTDASIGTPGNAPFAGLVSLDTVQPTEAGIATLQCLSQIGRHLGTALLAGANSRFAGCESFAESADPDDWSAALDDDRRTQWQQFRQSAGGNVSLLAPRFLLRPPYGKKSDATESFAFEECAPSPDHADYLWGPASILGALLFGKGFTEQGWNLRVDAPIEVDRLPLFVYDDAGERVQKPCAEAWLTERSGAALAANGLTAVYSVRNRDAVLLPGLHNAADPPGPLQGPWS